ncbi:MAG: DUF1330 domain-containing protein [Saprospiraceae bacterium]
MHEKYLNPSQESGRDFIHRKISGNVVMLNLLRFKENADYKETPELSPITSITGEMAYQLYMKHTLPFLKKAVGEILFFGKGGNFLIGPSNEIWDAVMLIRQTSVDSFISFASHPEYLKGIGHRNAALEDSRLLPIIELENFGIKDLL